MYKFFQDQDKNWKVIIRLFDNANIPLSLDNTDYQTFKYEILNDQAELQNANGETMSPEEAKDFVRTLP